MQAPRAKPDPDLCPGGAQPVRHFCARAALFVLGLALLIAALAPLDRLADVDVVGEKLEHLRRHAEVYDTLFVGSSTLYRGVSPAVYDAELAARGIAARSFNFGVLGMVPPETYYLLERILALRPPRLATVYLELAFFQKRVKRTHSRRFDYWHTPAQTANVLRAIARSEWPWEWKVSQSARHLESLARRTFHVGQGRALGQALLAPFGALEFDAELLGPHQDGWLSTEDDASNRMKLRRGEVAGAADDFLADEVARLRADDTPGRRESVVGLRALAEAVARVRASGATPILLVPPCLDRRSGLIEFARGRLGVEVLAFNDPDRYPELYSPDNRFDHGHVNKEGAAAFSRALAARFAERTGH